MKDLVFLVELLGKTDALWLPRRSLAAREHFSVRRQQYADAGVPWTSGEAAAAQRKAEQRRLEDAAASGDVEVFKSGGRAAGVRLTDEGEAAAREAVGLPGIEHAREVAAELLAKGDVIGGVVLGNERWVPECVMGCCEWGDPCAGGNLWGYLETYVAPALVRGWILSNCTTAGHAYYSVTVAGAEAAATATPQPAPPEGMVKFWKAYRRAVKDEEIRIAAIDPGREIGEIPFAMSAWTSANLQRYQTWLAGARAAVWGEKP